MGQASPHYPERDLWPLTRLLILTAVLFAQATSAFGWRIPIVDLPALSGRMLMALFGLAVVSSSLVCLCVMLCLLLLLAFALLDDYSYKTCRWLLRCVFRLRCRPVLAGFSLAGEIGLFVWGFILLRRAFVGF